MMLTRWLDIAGRRFVQTRHPYLALLLLCVALWLPGFFSLPPSDRDEARFAQASKQMLETGDFVRIRFGEEARNRKPVGIHWLQIPFVAAARATGVAAANPVWPYRIPSALGGLAAVFLTFGLGRRLVGRQAALLAATMLAGAVLLAVETHIAKTDAVLLGLTTCVMLLLSRAYLDPDRFSARLAVGFWLAMGAAVLVKGPVTPLIAGLTIIALVIADRHVRGAGWLRALRPAWGIPLALLVVLPWFIAIFAATGGEFFRDSLGGDLGGKLTGGAEAHGAPPGYYLLLAPLLLFPACIPVLLALPAAWYQRAEPLTRFLLAWIIPTWLLFEIVPTKLPHYVLPIFPALFLLGARWMLDSARRAPPDWLRRVAVVSFSVVAVLFGLAGLGGAIALLGTLRDVVIYGVPVLLGALLLLSLGLSAAQAQKWRLAGLTVLAMPLLTWPLLGLMLPSLTPIWISPRVVQALGEHAPQGTMLASLGFHEPSLVFLAGTNTALLRSHAEAVAFLAATPGRALLVSDHQRVGFETEAARAGLIPRSVAEVSGLNYVNGRRVVLTLYLR